MIIGNVSVHGVEATDLVSVHSLPQSGVWVLSLGGVDFYATQLDALALVIDRARHAIARAQP
jgi:hypothetical protein